MQKLAKEASFCLTLFYYHFTEHTCLITFHNQGCDSEECHNAFQVDASCSFWRKGTHSLKVANAWLKDSLDYASISDAPNIEGKPNIDGFEDHRHDQAILTNVLVLENWAYQNDKDFRQVMATYIHDRNRS